jgi:hypothetical protein
MLPAIVAAWMLAGCGSSTSNKTVAVSMQVTTPVITTTAALNGAVIASLSDSTSQATIYYTTDGMTPSASSLQYLAPMLITNNITLNAMAVASSGSTLIPSAVSSETFTPNVASGTLVWSDEFSNTTGVNAEPNPAVWTYDTGNGGFGNNELENYCAWGENVSPCSAANPNV